MPKRKHKPGPAILSALLPYLLVSYLRQLNCTLIVQPPGASCIVHNETTATTIATTSSLKYPSSRLKVNANNNSIQMTAKLIGPADESAAESSASQVTFETICDGWENSISSRAFWLLDRPRQALIAKFVYQDKQQIYDHPEAKLSSPLFPSVPNYHWREDSKYYQSCRLRFKLYSTIASQLEVAIAPIQTVVSGSSSSSPSLTASSPSLTTAPDSYLFDTKTAAKNRQMADKFGESSVWAQHEIIVFKNSNLSNNIIPIPYKIEFSAMPTRVSSSEMQASDYLIGVALANISLSPECFGLNIDDEEQARLSHFRQHQNLMMHSSGQSASHGLHLDNQVNRLLHEHGALLLVLMLVGSLIVGLVYCGLNLILKKSKLKHSYNNRQRIYVAANKHEREEQLMQKHHLHPIPLSMVDECVELRDNPNYASLAHENNRQTEVESYEQHRLDNYDDDNDNNNDDDDDDEYIGRYEADEWEIKSSNVILCEQIGTGAFGMVYLGQLLTDDGRPTKRCAIKTLPATATLKQRMDFLREASIMKQFNTFHVVKLLGMVSTTNPVYVIMEYMENGDLKSYLRRLRELHQRQNKRLVDGAHLMAARIADGMAYLASKRFVHRDLAARNCMVDEKGVVKVGDFGLTRDIYDNEYYRRGSHGRLPVRWMAPESLLDNIYTSASDVWSYGIVVWEIVTFGAYPYQGQSNDEVIQLVCAGSTMARPDNCPSDLYSIMQRCWRRDSQVRPNFCELVEELLPETGGQLYPNCFYRGSLMMGPPKVANHNGQGNQRADGDNDEIGSRHLARLEPDNNSRAESYPMISDDRKPLVALYPVVH